LVRVNLGIDSTRGLGWAPYSQDLRERVISVVDGGLGAYEIAPSLRGSVSCIYKALGRQRETCQTPARFIRTREILPPTDARPIHANA
jgi:hypothetical protein